jgi:hypothetical protein
MSTITAADERRVSSIRDVLSLHPFRLLWLGFGSIVLAEQFYLIALPWLALQLTNDAFAMGTVLAVSGVPRALFMLLGGALTDRFSPRTIVVGGNILRGSVVAGLALLLVTGLLQVWMLYFFALLYGLADAFYLPASGAIVPQLLDKDQLQAGNSVIQGTIQACIFAAPLLAGLVIAILGSGQGASETTTESAGIAAAFGISVFAFLVSVITIFWLKIRKRREQTATHDGVFSSIRAGLSYTWHDTTLRTWFVIIAALNLLFNGPFFVGIPVLADSRFPEGAAAFGVLVSAFGGGSVIGTILAGLLPKPAQHHLGSILLVILSTQGLELALLGFVTFTPLAALLTLGMGVANGYIIVLWVTWLQTRTPAVMMGRVWSLVMFSVFALQPVSQALAGAFIRVDATLLFAVSGVLLAIVTLLSALVPSVRAMGVDVEIPPLTVVEAIRRTGELPITTAPLSTGTSEIPVLRITDETLGGE